MYLVDIPTTVLFKTRRRVGRVGVIELETESGGLRSDRMWNGRFGRVYSEFDCELVVKLKTKN